MSDGSTPVGDGQAGDRSPDPADRPQEPRSGRAGDRWPVSEVFGPVIQGEGPLQGVPTTFLRFAGCDYRCSWCDTPYAVLPEQWSRTAVRMSTTEIAAALDDLDAPTPWVTISGGNPAIYNLVNLVHYLRTHAWLVAVETQGSRWHPWLGGVDQLVVSPKPPSSGMEHSAEDFKRWVDLLWRRGWDSGQPALKIVVFDDADLRWAIDLADQTWPSDWPLYLSVGTTPGGDRAAVRTNVCDRLAALCESVVALPVGREVRVGAQLHVLAYGHARGV